MVWSWASVIHSLGHHLSNSSLMRVLEGGPGADACVEPDIQHIGTLVMSALHFPH